MIPRILKKTPLLRLRTAGMGRPRRPADLTPSAGPRFPAKPHQDPRRVPLGGLENRLPMSLVLPLFSRVRGLMRLDKLASQRFGLSRRAAQEAVRRGQVDVAGQTCFEPGQVVAPDTPLEYHPSRPR